MNHFFKILIFSGFILSFFGVIMIYSFLRHHHSMIPENFVTESFAFCFWYLEPIIGLILIFGSKKRKIKYFGLFFFILWACAVIGWVKYYTYG
jgi:hypothetical protein